MIEYLVDGWLPKFIWWCISLTVDADDCGTVDGAVQQFLRKHFDADFDGV